MHSKEHNFDLIFMKPSKCKSTRPCSKLGYLGQKGRSLGQIIEKLSLSRAMIAKPEDGSGPYLE